MKRLSRPLGDMRAQYDVVIIGSGYGGSITADALARTGKRVCVLERGKELHPGDYPDTPSKGVHAMQADVRGRTLGSPTALYDFRLYDDISVLVGCGLGGTSLINAGVTLEASRDVFDDNRWPVELRDPKELQKFYDPIRTMFGTTDETGADKLAKFQSLQASAVGLGATATPAPINVTFKDGPNAAGVEQKKCVLCGDCVSGCNHNAKNTLLMNFLPAAFDHGAEIFTEVEVRTVTPWQNGLWKVTFAARGVGRELFDAPPQFVAAKVVVLAAGTLGTTEILLRSREAGLPVSPQLGEHFSGNGDYLGFGYDAEEPVHGMGFGRRRIAHPVGPTITGLIDLRDRDDHDRRLVIEEGAAPGPLAQILPIGLAAAARKYGRENRRPLTVVQWVWAGLTGPYRGPTDRTQIYLVMATDDDSGRAILENDRIRVNWSTSDNRLVFSGATVDLRRAANAVGASYIGDAPRKTLVGNSLISVHPLGGAIMADDAASGVVNHEGQVFAAGRGDRVHKGLYVADGSIIPRPLGVNPLLTISALAMRTSEAIARTNGWPQAAQHPVVPPEAPSKPGLRFTEAMRGSLAAVDRPPSDASELDVIVTIEFDDLEGLLHDPAIQGRLSGTVTAPALSGDHLTVTDGAFQLFAPDDEHVDTLLMRYKMTLIGDHGARCDSC